MTYLVFPGTADKPFGPPNLDKWHEKVSAYINELGGLGEGYTVYKWDSPFARPKPPAPVVAEGDKKPESSTETKSATPASASADGAKETVKPAVPASSGSH